jgi:hypothetical protein
MNYIFGLFALGVVACFAGLIAGIRRGEVTTDVPDKIEPPRWVYEDEPRESCCHCDCGCRALTRHDRQECFACGDGFHLPADEHEIVPRPRLRIVK